MLSHMLRAASPTLVGNLSVSYIGTTQSNSPSSTQTFNGVSIGTADVFRRVVVTVGTVGTSVASTVNSVTVNGGSLTKHVEETGAVGVAIFSGVVKSGTTATIVVTGSSSNMDVAIRVFTVTGATSSYSASDSVSGTSTSVSTPNDLTVTANDVAVFAASQQSANAVSETSTQGSLTESSDVTFTASSTRRTAAGYIVYNSASTKANVTLTGDSAITKRIAYVVFTSP